MSSDESEPGGTRPGGEKRTRFRDIGPGRISAIGTLLAAVFAGIALLISNAGGSSPGGTTPTQPAGTILAPPTCRLRYHCAVSSCSLDLMVTPGQYRARMAT